MKEFKMTVVEIWLTVIGTISFLILINFHVYWEGYDAANTFESKEKIEPKIIIDCKSIDGVNKCDTTYQYNF